jgi:hypothetical protein
MFLELKNFIDAYVHDERGDVSNMKMLFALSHPAGFNAEIKNIMENISDNNRYGLYNMLAKSNIMLIDHFMVYDNYRKVDPNVLPADQFSSDHIGELIMLHRYCVEKLTQKYDLETSYSLYQQEGYDWNMNLQTKFESDVEKLCQANNISPKMVHDASYYNPFNQSKVIVSDCKCYDIPRNLMEQALNSAYNVDKIVAKVDENYQLCNENTHRFDIKVWILSILHYVLTVDMPL